MHRLKWCDETWPPGSMVASSSLQPHRACGRALLHDHGVRGTHLLCGSPARATATNQNVTLDLNWFAGAAAIAWTWYDAKSGAERAVGRRDLGFQNASWHTFDPEPLRSSQSPGCRNCRNCRNCRTTVGPLSELTVGLTVGHCLTLSDYRTWHHPPALSDTVGQLSDTVGRLSDTVGRLSDCRRQLVGDHRTTLNAGMKACACCKVL